MKHKQNGGNEEQQSPTSSSPGAKPPQNSCAENLSGQEQHHRPDQRSGTSDQKKTVQWQTQKPSRKICREASSRHETTEDEDYIPTLPKPALALFDPAGETAQRASLKPVS